MQVSVEAGEGLERKLTVQVPAETVEQEVNNRLNSMKHSVRVDGFRPGKVPLKVLKQKYSQAVLQEVAGDLMQSTFRDALAQENLRPAGDPRIEAEPAVLGEAMQYTAIFEVYPEVAVASLSDMAIEKTSAEVADSDVDNMIEVLRKQKMDWQEVEREATDGDRVTIDFVGSIDGEEFDGGSGKDMPVELGSGQMIDGFEEALKGLVDFSRIEQMLERTRGRIDHVALDRLSPLSAPLFLEIGKVPVEGSARERLISEEATRLMGAAGLA